MRSWPRWTWGHIHLHVENKIKFPGLGLFLTLDNSGVSLWQQWTHPGVKLQRHKWNRSQTVVRSVGTSSLFSLEINLAWESGPSWFESFHIFPRKDYAMISDFHTMHHILILSQLFSKKIFIKSKTTASYNKNY